MIKIILFYVFTQNPLLDHVKKNPRKQNTQPGLLLFLEYGPTRDKRFGPGRCIIGFFFFFFFDQGFFIIYLSRNRPLPYSQNDTTLLFPN